MWCSAWSIVGAVVAIFAVLIATVATAWTPIFGIVIVLALIPLIGAVIVARNGAQGTEDNVPDSVPGHLAGPAEDVRLEDGMVSDRKRAGA